MNVLKNLPGMVEGLVFRNRKTNGTTAVSYIVLNVILMLGVFYILLNTIVYDWTGTMYAHGFHLNTALDNAIPFAPTWAIFYLYLFYPLTTLTLIYFGFIEYRHGYALAWSVVLINLVSDLVYLVFPVTTDAYRAALLAHPLVGNSFATAIYHVFATDPSYNCFPSLHASISVICFYAWYRFAKDRRHTAFKVIAAAMGVVALGVMLSTLFVKQHYIADEISGFLLAWGVGAWMYGKRGVIRTDVKA